MAKPRLKNGVGTKEQLAAAGYAPMKVAMEQMTKMTAEMNRKASQADEKVWLKWHIQMYYGHERE